MRTIPKSCLQKEYKFLIKSYKKEWELTNIKKLTTLTENPKAFWSHLKSLRGKSKVTSKAPNLIAADSWVEHFSTLCHRKQTDQDKRQVIDNLRKNCGKTDSTLDAPITIEEICKTIKELKTNEATGHDSIINEMLKEDQSVISPFLATLFNKILETQYYPEEWSIGIITPLHKTGELDSPDNYRWITLNSCISKLCTRLLNNRLTEVIENKNLLKHNQIGFRKGFCTADLVLTVKTLIDKYLSQNKKLYLCFVDFKKAYGTVWRIGLLSKLQSYGISNRFINLLYSMSSKTESNVQLQNGLTRAIPTTIGLNKGVISAQFFLIYLLMILTTFLMKSLVNQPNLLTIE